MATAKIPDSVPAPLEYEPFVHRTREKDHPGAAEHGSVAPEYSERAAKGDLSMRDIADFESRSSFECGDHLPITNLRDGK